MAQRLKVELEIKEEELEEAKLALEKKKLENSISKNEVSRLKRRLEQATQGTNADGSGPSTSSSVPRDGNSAAARGPQVRSRSNGKEEKAKKEKKKK